MFSSLTVFRRYRGFCSTYSYNSVSILTRLKRISAKYKFFQFVCIIIFTCILLNIFIINHINCCPSSSTNDIKSTSIPLELKNSSNQLISTIERSQKALEKLKSLLNSVKSQTDQPWIWFPTEQYPSVPYQPTSLSNQKIPKSIQNSTLLPQSINDEINRVCKRLNEANKIGGEIWCKLFTKCYSDTLATTTTLLDDNTTFIITGDIDLMWLRDSSAQVHQYMSLSNDENIQRIIEGLIRRQTLFIFANPYGSSFRLTLRPNPPSDDSLEPIHVRKGRNVHVSMHNYELDSLCYHLRLSYTWWKQTRRTHAFDRRWLTAISIIIQVMIIEQHHSEISPYRYTELRNNHKGSPVAYTGMTWSAFRPSDDPTKFGYLIPSNMMATVVLQQLIQMIEILFPEEIELLKQIRQLREDILSGIHTYGLVKHNKYGNIYAYETDGFSQSLLIDDANVPSLLSASYLGFKTPYDPNDQLITSTNNFILSSDNPLYFQGKIANGIGSHHTDKQFVWPMSIIMEGFQNISEKYLDSVWQRLELSHAGTFAMHESFDVNNPSSFTRKWFAWVNSLFSELIIVRLNDLEDWLKHRRVIT